MRETAAVERAKTTVEYGVKDMAVAVVRTL